MIESDKESPIKIRIEDSIALITIESPETLNALSNRLLDELETAFTNLENTKIRAIVITGCDKSFVAGADISEMANFSAIEGRAFALKGSGVFRKIEKLSIPVIAAINGYALGGGCELAMSCDIRIASNKAKFGQPEVNLGITPGFSGTQRLARLVGIGKAKELIYTAEIISADEAERIGLVNKVVPGETLIEEAISMAKKIAQKAPIAIKFSKQAINCSGQIDIESGISMEANLFGLCFSTEDQKKGMAAFLNKEKTEFIGK